MFYLHFFIISSLTILQSCNENQNRIDTGRIEVIDLQFRQYLHSDTFLRKPYWDITEKIWRKDSVIIEQVRSIKIDEDAKGKAITTYPVLLYRYNDLRTGSRYEYWSFTDSATLRRKFSQHDSLLAVGGWNLYKMKDQLRGGSIKYLPDTTIDGKNYIHAHIRRDEDSIKYHVDVWFLPEKRSTFFSLDTGIYHKTGRPMVGYHIYPEGKKGLNIMQGVTFIADTLSEAEEKMFLKWEQYAKEHPVKSRIDNR